MRGCGLGLVLPADANDVIAQGQETGGDPGVGRVSDGDAVDHGTGIEAEEAGPDRGREGGGGK